jgi:hypothetical protein
MRVLFDLASSSDINVSSDTKNATKGSLTGKLASLAAAAVAAFAPLTVRAATPPVSFFPIGVFLQPTTTFATWKARGVNTVVDYAASSQSQQVWDAAAAADGLYTIRAPSANPASDINDPNLIAWSQTDEPELKGISAAFLLSEYDTLKKIDPSMPVYINFSGANVLNTPDKLTPTYQAMVQAGDIISNDVYPVTAWSRPQWIDFSQPMVPNDPENATGIRWNPGTAIDALRQMSGGKEQWAYIETSYQDLTSPWANSVGVTPDQLRGEVWDAIIHGAKGITYFPQEVGKTVFLNDNTPAAVAAEITTQDALITSLGGVINSSSSATDNRITLTTGGTTNPLLEATWRTYEGQKYLFVLNMSSETLKSVSFSTAGLQGLGDMQVFDESRMDDVKGDTLTDTFGAYQLHIYDTLGDSVAVGSAAPVPEPTTIGLVLASVAFLLPRRRRKSR